MGTNAANRYAPMRRRKLLEPGLAIDPPIAVGEGWERLGGGAWEWNAPTTEVNPTLTFSGLVAGALYAVQVIVTVFTGTGTLTVTLGDATPIMTFSDTGTQTGQFVAGVTDDEFDLIINTNATMTRVAVKDIQIVRIK